MEDPKMQAVLGRIEKLMALSRSSNPNEAAIALSRAQKLMREHHIGQGDLRLDAVGETAIETLPGLRRAAYVLRLASITARSFGLRYFFTSGRSGVASITLIGPKDRLDGAAYVHVFLQRQLKAALGAYRKARRQELRDTAIPSLEAIFGPAARAFFGMGGGAAPDGALESALRQDCYSYAMGWLSAVREKVRDFALDEQEERLMIDYERKTHPDLLLSTAGRRGRRVNAEFYQGEDDGREGFELLKGVGGIEGPKIGFKR
jgi:hypothetical protein